MKTKQLEQQVKDILLKHTKTNYTMQLADIVEAISNLVEEEKRKAKIEAKIEEMKYHLKALNATPSEYNEVLSMPLQARLEELSNE